MSSICVEGLLRVAAETMGPTQPQADPEDVAAFQNWLSGPPSKLSQPFLSRLNGLLGMFRNLSVAEIFRDWAGRGVLGVTMQDLKAWSDTRNPSAHGRLGPAESQDELQARVSRHDRVKNLLNKIVLQLMGYTGLYIDYSRPGYVAAQFPLFTAESDVATAGISAASKPSDSVSQEFQHDGHVIQSQAQDLPDQFEGWELCYRINGQYDQAFPVWAQSVLAAIRAKFPGATVNLALVEESSAPIAVTAPVGTLELQIARVREIARSIEDELAQRAMARTEPPVPALDDNVCGSPASN
jgi:hypothetical protein